MDLVEQALLYRVAGLRKRVLRPAAGPAPLALPGDDDPDTTHVAAYQAGVVGTSPS